MFIGKRTIYSRQRYLVNASFLSFFFPPILLPFLSTTCFLNQTALHLHQIGTNSCFLELGKLLYILTNLKKKKFLPILSNFYHNRGKLSFAIIFELFSKKGSIRSMPFLPNSQCFSFFKY